MKSHTPARRICSQVFLMLVALGSVACSARSDRLTVTGISAEEVASSAQTADIVATAIMEDVRYENYPDTMDGTMVWRVTRCHAGTCVAGEQLKTRFSGPFSTSGEFCDLRNGCLKRKSLESYTSGYLRFVWTLAATAVVLCYALFAFERDGGSASWWAISIIPFTIAILRYAVDIDGGHAGEPEEIALGDRVLQVLALALIGTVGAAAYFS